MHSLLCAAAGLVWGIGIGYYWAQYHYEVIIKRLQDMDSKGSASRYD